MKRSLKFLVKFMRVIVWIVGIHKHMYSHRHVRVLMFMLWLGRKNVLKRNRFNLGLLGITFSEIVIKNQNTQLLIHENASENIVCEIPAILSRGRWVKLYEISRDLVGHFVGCRPIRNNVMKITAQFNNKRKPKNYYPCFQHCAGCYDSTSVGTMLKSCRWVLGHL